MKDPVEVTTGKVLPEREFRPTGLILYGVPATIVKIRTFKIEMNMLDGERDDNNNVVSKLAVIYGYSYEGHCYSLPKPCIVVVDGPGEPAMGCGYDQQTAVIRALTGTGSGECKTETGPAQYCMWRADKLTKTCEISITSGFFEEIILQQNIGGPKPPVAYGARVQLAHRGGKLTE